MYSREFVDFLIEDTYRRGFEAGVEWARVAMDQAIRDAIDPGPEVDPGVRDAILSRTAKDVVMRLVDAMNRECQGGGQ